jgi:NAD(P)-dependent dehydrogenase (short-subunit alcohol dehydrogenase family)
MQAKKTAIITGASKGIGRAAALKLAAEGYNITLVARNTSELDQLSEALDYRFSCESLVIAGDLVEETFIRSIIEKTVTRWGRIDALINNAAWRTLETMRTISLEDWDRTLRICVTAPAFLARYAAEVMETKQAGGTIINLSSVMSSRAGGTSPAYISSKGAIESLTYELAVTYGRSGIRVVCVQPGFIETGLSSDYTDPEGKNISDQLTDQLISSTPLGRGGKPEEIADAISWLCSDAASFITGTTLLIDGGFRHNFNNYSLKKLQFPEEF